MSTTVLGGVLIGVLCSIWTFVMGFTGWYKDPVMLSMFYLVVLIEIAVLVWALKKTAHVKTYGGQVGAGVLMSVIGGVILIFSSLLFTTVAYPNYFEELRTVGAEVMRSEGKSEADIAREFEKMAPTQTPIMQALLGCLGTIATGLVASLVIAAFLRKKDDVASST